MAPTWAPTSDCIGLWVTDNNDLYNHWFHRKISTDDDGRSQFVYELDSIISTIIYGLDDGWTIILQDASSIEAIYVSNEHGLYPPLEIWQSFGDDISFYIEGLLTEWPTNTPSTTPTAEPTNEPTNNPSYSPSSSPTMAPTMS
eukprot:205870_1